MPAANKPSLVTLGDFFRLAERRFRAARLAYGHGTTNARDEAAFLVLEALRLPVHNIEPWLALKPTAAERARLITLIDARISLRLPAPYLVGAAYMHGVRFHVDHRALIPRSFIGDMLADGALPIGDPRRAKYLQWLFFNPACIEPAIVQLFTKLEIPARTAGWGDATQVFDVLDKALEKGPWLTGDDFFACDVVIGSGLNYAVRLFKMVPSRPSFERYIDRCVARPAFQRAAAAT